MGTDQSGSEDARLRQQAEERLHALGGNTSETNDLASILHELRVHQIELEMQKEELRRAQLALQTSYENYFELFDQAPWDTSRSVRTAWSTTRTSPRCVCSALNGPCLSVDHSVRSCFRLMPTGSTSTSSGCTRQGSRSPARYACGSAGERRPTSGPTSTLESSVR